MDMTGIGLFQLAGKRLDYLAQRHQVIAQNVVNANTPGYVAKDLQAFDKLMSELRPVAAARTNPLHLAGTRPAMGVQERARSDLWETTPDRNTVSLEQEMLKSSETREAYGLVANLYQKHAGMLRLAYGGHGG